MSSVLFPLKAKPLTRAALLLGAGLAAFAPSPVAAQAISGTLTELGSLGGSQSGFGSENDDSFGGSLSSDGSVMVGDAVLADNLTDRAFRWTASGGMVDLGTLGGTTSFACAVSGDGSVVVGGSSNGMGAQHAFRWTQGGGMVDLGTLGGSNSEANAVSGDGSVVVGAADTGSTQHAFRWTQGGGMADLGTLGGSFSSAAFGVSGDGSVVVGQADTGSATHAFRWTQGSGMADLGTLGGNNSSAFGVSGDGSVVVGAADTGPSAQHAFRWTQGSGMADLGTLGGSNSEANAVSSSGKVVVGQANITGNSTVDAFRWTQATGMQDLNTLLSNAGVNMSGIQLQFPGGISANGRYIAVTGNTPAFPSGEALLVYYDDGNGETVANGVTAGITSAPAQQASAQTLAADQRATLIEGRSAANQVLGFSRPMDGKDYAQTGAIFGSALGYASGQYDAGGFTLLGGFAYGSEDYPDVKQSNAPMIAVAGRTIFDVPYDDAGRIFHPFVEIGGWVTPQAALTLSRPYANGSGTSIGQGSTTSTAWSVYGRAGQVWNADGFDQFTYFGEIGEQQMGFAPYSESLSPGNPFPAMVSGGTLSMEVARLGGTWTHRLKDLLGDYEPLPLAVTLAGAAARSFDVHSGLTATVPGLGSFTAANQADTWGEFGARLTASVTDALDVNLDLNGTTGGGVLGTSVHGGAGITYKF